MHVVVESYGCTMNQGEAEDISRKLAARGHRVSHVSTGPGEWRRADVVVLATCIVIETTERKMLKRMREISGAGKKLVVTGCLPTGRKELLKDFPGVDFCGPGDREKVIRFIETHEQTFKTTTPACEKRSASGGTGETRSRLNPITHILPIAQGCLGACAYCITKRARGKLVSRPMDQIVREAARAIESGAREIRITAQDTAGYGRDTGTTLPRLLREITGIRADTQERGGSDIYRPGSGGRYPPGADGVDFRVRVGMMNPGSASPILGDLLNVFEHPGIFTFFHIPVQSGDDGILERMNRSYTVEEFESIVRRIREKFGARVSISTDIIVGFPGEGEEEFHGSVELLRRVRPDILNVTRFSPRPGTGAAALRPTVHGRVVKEWSRELSELRFELARHNNERFVGMRLWVLLLEKGRGGKVIGRTGFYKPVVLPGAHAPGMGEFVEVEITGCADTYLEGAFP